MADCADIDILMVCIENTAGVFTALCDSINKYTPYKARFVEYRNTYLDYGHDLLLSTGDRNAKLAELNALARNCKVIHWNQIQWNERATVFKGINFSFAPYLNNKTHTCHHHGTILRERSHNPHGFKKIFLTTPDLLYYSPEGVFMPIPMNIKYDIKTTFPTTKLILHCPAMTTRTIAQYCKMIRYASLYYPKDYPPNYSLKCTEMFNKAMASIKNKQPVDYKVISGMDNTALMRIKAASSMYLNEIFFGCYGVNVIESMGLGKPVLGRIDEHSKTIFKVWNNDDCPVLQIEYKTLEEDITRHLKCDEVEVGKVSRKWIKKMHDPRRLAKFFVEQVMEGK